MNRNITLEDIRYILDLFGIEYTKDISLLKASLKLERMLTRLKEAIDRMNKSELLHKIKVPNRFGLCSKIEKLIEEYLWSIFPKGALRSDIVNYVDNKMEDINPITVKSRISLGLHTPELVHYAGILFEKNNKIYIKYKNKNKE